MSTKTRPPDSGPVGDVRDTHALIVDDIVDKLIVGPTHDQPAQHVVGTESVVVK